MLRATKLLLLVVLAAACTQVEETPPPPPAPTLADFAGTWNNTATLTGVADPVPSTLSGTADPASWTMTLEGRSAIPVTVSIVGDSLIGQTAEYESVLRPGVMVSVRTASVLSGGMLSGNLVATYKTPAGEEVVRGTMHGMRAQQE